ncbi:hypothetical protein [Acidovorax sp. K2F]|uniref:hypothetical protein n=1 Tax=Acidovorax sp. K2F TaxID=2978125 RepID=UPI0021B0F870|nr:hypothetical protein [Acidovorax sp. K2F]MCT6719805.1 hypothetical protein [Acidovorax sp. K2F]
MTNQQGAPEALANFDAAVAAVLQCVSTAPCNSHEICTWFAANIRERLAALVEAQQPAPSAAAAVEAEREGLRVAIRSAIQASRYHFSDPIRRDAADRVLLDLLDDINARTAAPQPSPTPQPAQVRDYPPLTIAEARDLTCMLAGAPWPDEMLPELLQLLAIYDNLRSDNARPVDPASLPSDMAQAVISTARNPAVSEQTAEPTGFWEWVRQAYRAPESTSFTVHNMAVAYRAGRDADRAARAPADSVTAPAAGAVAGQVEKQVQRIGKELLRSEQMHAAKPDRIASALRAMSESMHTDYKQEIGSNNCMQCCVAYMLGMPISQVPHFAQGNDPVACWDGFQSFIAKQGYTAVMLPGDQRPESHYLASGKSARGTSHMVVMHDGKLLHDPHPTNAGLVDVQCIWLLAKSAAAPTPPTQAADSVLDSAFEAVRKNLCALQRHSFCLDDDGVVRRVRDRTGNWIEFDDAHELFDPVAVDAARKQGANHD